MSTALSSQLRQFAQYLSIGAFLKIIFQDFALIKMVFLLKTYSSLLLTSRDGAATEKNIYLFLQLIYSAIIQLIKSIPLVL